MQTYKYNLITLGGVNEVVLIEIFYFSQDITRMMRSRNGRWARHARQECIIGMIGKSEGKGLPGRLGVYEGILLWRVDPLLGNDHERGSYTIAVAK
jgi:hypothetical protein